MDGVVKSKVYYRGRISAIDLLLALKDEGSL